MNGMELSKAFYTEIGEPMLREKFPELLPFLAVGLTGSGSECYGFDDEISQDHDFEPGFCIFVPGENIVDRKSAFALERAYAALPRQFRGFERERTSPVGGARHGVLRTADFMTEKVGAADGRLSILQWLSIPDYALAEAVNGEIFTDPYGEITAIRDRIRNRPEDIRRKKLAGHILLMAQSGQYNYLRCLGHGETAAAQLAVVEYVQNVMAAAFLLGGVYQPYYKWSFRAMRNLPVLPFTAELLEYLLTTDNGPKTREEKYKVIEDIAADVIGELSKQGLTKSDSKDLERHAYSVNDRVEDPQLRNMHILAGV